MKFLPKEVNAKVVFQIHPPVSGLNISNNISVPRVSIRETEHETTFEISLDKSLG